MQTLRHDEPVRLDRAVERTAEWLLSHQDDSGGWAQHTGRRPNVLNTAEALIALLTVGAIEAGDRRIRKAVKFLLDHQGDQGYWCREVATEGGAILTGPDVLRTALVVQALRKAGTGSDEPATEEAVRWLVTVQGRDGGWAYTPLDDGSAVLATCASLEALIGADEVECEPCVLRGLNYLKEAQNEDGSFDRNPFLQGPATVGAVLTLQRLRKANRSTPYQVEKKAIEWILSHKDAVLRPVEQEIALDRQDSRLTYSFLHFPATGVVAALVGAEDPDCRDTQLFTQALRAIGDRVDRTSGGVFGDRVLSWSTARGGVALWHAAHHRSAIPLRSPEPAAARGLTAPQLVLILIVIALIIVVVVLSLAGAFGGLQAGFFVAMVLVLLLVLSFVSPDRFERLFSRFGFMVGPRSEK
jgi:squalene cyclase